MAAEPIPKCGFCNRPFDALQENLAKVRACGHEFHANCLLNENGAHIKTTKKFKEIHCPEATCKEQILKAPKAEFAEKIIEHIEIRPFSNPATAAKNQGLALFKKTAYLITTVCCALLAVAISPTWLSLGVGLAIAVPCSWLVGKLLDRYMKQ